jgi:RNA polymerase sigma-70 factor (ECF subfamily)
MGRDLQQITDEWLVLAARGGSSAALEALVRRWQPKLLAHACQVTGRRDAACDVVQEAWLSILRSLDRLRDPAAFRSWAYRIVHARAVDWVRHDKRRRDASKKQILEYQQVERTSARESAEDRQALVAAMEKLQPDEKLLLRMYYLDRMRIVEIAAVLEIPSGTVKYRLYQIRKTLKSIIEGERHAPQKH